MPAPAIVEFKIRTESFPSLGNRTVCFQIYILIFHTPPETLDENIIHPTALAVHADTYTLIFKNSNESIRCELAALVRKQEKGTVLLNE